MRVTITFDRHGEKDWTNYSFHGLKRMPAIIRAVEAYRHDLHLARYPITGIKTTRKD